MVSYNASGAPRIMAGQCTSRVACNLPADRQLHGLPLDIPYFLPSKAVGIYPNFQGFTVYSVQNLVKVECNCHFYTRDWIVVSSPGKGT